MAVIITWSILWSLGQAKLIFIVIQSYSYTHSTLSSIAGARMLAFQGWSTSVVSVLAGMSRGPRRASHISHIRHGSAAITLTCSDYLALFGAAGNPEDASIACLSQLLSMSLYQVSTGRYTDSSDNTYFYIFKSE